MIDQGGRPLDVGGANDVFDLGGADDADVDVAEGGKYGGGGTRDAESTVKTSMPENKSMKF